MRKLCAAHKKKLNEIYSKRDVSLFADLTLSEINELEEIGDFETIHQCIDRYLLDKKFADLRKV